jgi:glycogen debranching enzyme
MPVLSQTNEARSVCVPIPGLDMEELLDREWLLTNERGSYSSSSIIGCNTSGYHGLLIGSPEPLVSRVMALSNCLEAVRWRGQVLELSTFEFPGRFAPTGYTCLREFRRDMGARFQFHLEPADLSKAVYLARDSDTVVVEYTFEEVREPLDFALRPFVGLRDYHTLQSSHASLVCTPGAGVVRVRHAVPASNELTMGGCGLEFTHDPQWWFNFLYRVNRTRGFHCREDLWTPGWFQGHIEQAGRVAFWARLTDGRGPAELTSPDVDVIKKDLLAHQRELTRRMEAGRGGPSWRAKRSPLALRGRAERSPALPDVGERERPRHARGETPLCVGPADGIFGAARGRGDAGCDALAEILGLAADQFVVKRRRDGAERPTIVAGYPWFADWGRDTCLSLPGLLLATGREQEAGAVLRTFAAAVDEGMIPNRFDDRTGAAQFNSVDASLWFIHAAFEYLDATENTDERVGDVPSAERGQSLPPTRSGEARDTFMRDLLPAIRAIIDAYHTGTRFGIHADADGLITAGDEDTQLTWMDARYDGVAFTPRYGKAVEVNALWHSALRRMEKLHAGTRNSKSEIRNAHYGAMAEQVGRSFRKRFWNEQRGYLNDVVLPDGAVDASLRPNQVFAVSLPYAPPLTRAQRRAIVEVVERELLTPYGLRTLNRQDVSYRGRYEGSPRSRDEAYHQGTVWAYLIGPFVEAYLKVHDFRPQARIRAADLLRPLLHHLVGDACLGSVSEIFDGDPPHTPRGCPAQAWSVAELIRACRLVAGPPEN